MHSIWKTHFDSDNLEKGMIILTYGEKNTSEHKKKRMFGLNSNHAEKYTCPS